MGFSPVHTTQFVKTLDTSETPHLGGFTMPYDLELAHIRLTVYIHNTAGLGGSEQLRLGLYSRSDLAGLVVSSDWVTVATWSTEVGTANGAYQIGLMRFDFTTRQWLDADTEYHLAIESNNYTRNGGTFYIATVCDWPDPVNTPATNGAYFAAQAAFYGYIDREKPA